MKMIKLSKEEKEIEEAIIRGEYTSVSKNELNAVIKAIKARKKDTVLNIRVNKQDLDLIKKKAKKLGVKYQTLLSEFIHRLAQN